MGATDYMVFYQYFPYPTFAPLPDPVEVTDPAVIAKFEGTGGLTAPNIRGSYLGLIYGRVAGGGYASIRAEVYYYASEPARPFRIYCGGAGVLRVASVPPWFD